MISAFTKAIQGTADSLTQDYPAHRRAHHSPVCCTWRTTRARGACLRRPRFLAKKHWTGSAAHRHPPPPPGVQHFSGISLRPPSRHTPTHPHPTHTRTHTHYHKRFEKEVAFLRRCTHKNLIEPLGLCHEAPNFALVLPYYEKVRGIARLSDPPSTCKSSRPC